MKNNPRVVLDTNVLVSVLLKPNSIPGIIVQLVLQGQVTVVLTQNIFEEYRAVVFRPRFNLPLEQCQQILTFLSILGEWVAPGPIEPSPQAVLDPFDLPFGETAISANVDALVTGNLKHFSFMKPYAIPVLNPKEFIDWLQQGTTSGKQP